MKKEIEFPDGSVLDSHVLLILRGRHIVFWRMWATVPSFPFRFLPPLRFRGLRYSATPLLVRLPPYALRVVSTLPLVAIPTKYQPRRPRPSTRRSTPHRPRYTTPDTTPTKRFTPPGFLPPVYNKGEHDTTRAGSDVVKKLY